MFVRRKEKIIKINKIVKEAKRGGLWCELEGFKKLVLISPKKIYESEEAIIQENENIKKRKQKQEEKWKETDNQIQTILDKIYDEFNIIVSFLSRPISVADAWKMYHHIKNNKENYENVEKI